MTVFDKICAVLAFLLGIVFLVLGALGLFLGCRANFSLPPILGALPALVGWGIVRSIYLAWDMPRRGPPPDVYTPPPVQPPFIEPTEDPGYYRPASEGPQRPDTRESSGG